MSVACEGPPISVPRRDSERLSDMLAMRSAMLSFSSSAPLSPPLSPPVTNVVLAAPRTGDMLPVPTGDD